jgi:multiple sugar transport system substrate-binding protein
MLERIKFHLFYVRIFMLIIVIGMISVMQMGCSKTEEKSSKTTIVLGYYALPGDPEKVMKQLIADFQVKHPDIQVVTQVSPYEEFFQKLKTQVAANKAPDVWLSDGVFVPAYAERGVLKELTPWIDRDLQRKDYLMVESHMDNDGKIWAFPQGLQVLVLYYNKKLFDEAKLAYPTKDWTLDDLLKAAKKLTKSKKGNGQIDQYGFTVGLEITGSWYPVIKQFGGMLLDKTLTKSEINNPQTIQAIQYMCDLINKEKVAPSLADITSLGLSTNLFPSQAVAMQYGLYGRSIAANNSHVDYDVEMIPKGPGGRVVPAIANAWVIFNKSSPEKQAAAWEWIKFYSGKEPQLTWAKLGEAIPINREVAYSDAFLGIPTPPHNRKAFLDSLQYAHTMDVNGCWEEWTDAFSAALEPALNGKADAKTTAALADKNVQEVLDRYAKERK